MPKVWTSIKIVFAIIVSFFAIIRQVNGLIKHNKK